MTILTWEQTDNQKQNEIRNMMVNHFKLQDTMMNNLKYPILTAQLSNFQDFFENLTMHGTIIENNQTRYLFSPSLTGHIMNVASR